MKKNKKYLLLGILTAIIVCFIFPNQKSIIKTEIQIQAPLEEVYQFILEIDKVDDWFSAVHESEYVTEIKDAPGCVRQCKLEDGSIVKEQMIAAKKNELVKMEMIEHDLPVEYFRWDIETKSAGNNKTRVIQITEYKVKFGLIGVLLNQLLIKQSLEATFDRAYLELKKYIEKS